MAKKTILGIDIGHEQLKLVLVKGQTIKRSLVVAMPKNLLKEGKIISAEAMGELLRSVLKENKIRCKDAAVIMADDYVFTRSITMPVMSRDQLLYNLPFEFRDYIEGNYKKYLFDYAMVSTIEEIQEAIANPKKDEITGEAEAPQMELLAVASPKEYVDELKEMSKKAGLKLRKAAPVMFAYEAMIRSRLMKAGEAVKEYCFIDLGHRKIRIVIFKGDKYSTIRELDAGMVMADEAIAEEYAVDIELAHTYLETNFENCWSKEVCVNVWNSICVELMRSLNYYRFSNVDSNLEEVWLCGGGSGIKALQMQIQDYLQMDARLVTELFPDGFGEVEHGSILLQAYGITQE